MSGTAKWLSKCKDFPICTLDRANADPLPTARPNAFLYHIPGGGWGARKLHGAVDSQQMRASLYIHLPKACTGNNSVET